MKALVQTALSQSPEEWLLIIDNADDTELLLGAAGVVPLCNYLPFSRKGSILFTTRNYTVVRRLDIPRANVIRMTEMSRPEAIEMLQKRLDPSQISEAESTAKLLDFLENLPLAIKQASAYIDQAGISIKTYLDYCVASDDHLVELLSKDFEDNTRYQTTQNPVATAWLISFQHISRDNGLASEYLKFMSLLAEKEIPKGLLPQEAGCSNHMRRWAS